MSSLFPSGQIPGPLCAVLLVRDSFKFSHVRMVLSTHKMHAQLQLCPRSFIVRSAARRQFTTPRGTAMLKLGPTPGTAWPHEALWLCNCIWEMVRKSKLNQASDLTRIDSALENSSQICQIRFGASIRWPICPHGSHAFLRWVDDSINRSTLGCANFVVYWNKTMMPASPRTSPCSAIWAWVSKFDIKPMDIKTYAILFCLIGLTPQPSIWGITILCRWDVRPITPAKS